MNQMHTSTFTRKSCDIAQEHNMYDVEKCVTKSQHKTERETCL